MAVTEKNTHKDKYNRLFPHKVSTNSFLTLYVLHTLQKQNKMYGKEISDYIYDRFKGSWKPSHGMLYPILRKLEDDGLVKGYWEDGQSSKRFRRFYEITNVGKEAFDEHVESVVPQLTESEIIINTMKQDFKIAD